MAAQATSRFNPSKSDLFQEIADAQLERVKRMYGDRLKTKLCTKLCSAIERDGVLTLTVPKPTSVIKLRAFIHECQHAILGHSPHSYDDSYPLSKMEYEAEQETFKILRSNGISISPQMQKGSEGYVGAAVAYDIKHKVKPDPRAIRYSGAYVGKKFDMDQAQKEAEGNPACAALGSREMRSNPTYLITAHPRLGEMGIPGLSAKLTRAFKAKDLTEAREKARRLAHKTGKTQHVYDADSEDDAPFLFSVGKDGSVKNPAYYPEQYRLAQAVLSGAARDARMPVKVARELVERTPAKLRSKWSKRGNPEAGAESMYSSFHGTPSTSIDEYEEKEVYHSNLGGLAHLLGFKVRTVNWEDATISFSSVKSNPKEKEEKKRGRGFWPFNAFTHTTIYHIGPAEKKSKVKKESKPRDEDDKPFRASKAKLVGEFKGQPISKGELGFSAPGIDPNVHFDRKDDAKLFIASMLGGGKLKNPLLSGREIRCRHNPKGEGKSPSGPFTQSGQFVGNLLGTAYAPVNELIGGTATALDRGLGAVGIKDSKRKKRNPDHVLLCSTEDGLNLEIIGGDQSLDLEALGIIDDMANKELITVGEVWALLYNTTKRWSDDDVEEDQDYVHILGPKETKTKAGKDLWDHAVPPPENVFGTGELPTLVYSRRNRKIILSGGIYFISKPLFQTSPGLEH